MSLTLALVMALVAGLSMSLGALISTNTRLRSLCLQHEIDSFVSYFGGGALLAAIALVLVPMGMQQSLISSASISFLVGGILFWRLSTVIKRRGGQASQFTGMLLDFVPESIILGSAAASGTGAGLLLGALIALQNMPEGFAAFHEMRSGSMSSRRLSFLFLTVPLLGPIAAWIGYTWLPAGSHALGILVLFCSGGILYLIFEDIAPGAKLEHRDFPALGAVSGFVLGMIGVMLIH